MSSSKRYRLTTPAKVLILLVALVVIAGGLFGAVKMGWVKTDSPVKNNKDVKLLNDLTDSDGNVVNTEKTDKSTINLSLDEWIGWKEIIDANGGLSTKQGSIYDKLGIKVNISVINDATQSSNALISGDLDAAGYTINRTAFLSKKFKDANIDVIMPYITNFSNGGDGIIATQNIKSVNDFVGAKIGVPQFSEAHTLVVWFVNQSDLSDNDKKKIISDLVFFETPDEAAKAFFAGELDMAATWEPYLTQAQNMGDAKIFFSTKSASSLVMDGILFNDKFAKENAEVVSKFIDGALQASDLYDKDMETIKSVMPMFSTASNEEVKDNCSGAKLMTYADNLSQFTGAAKSIFTDMCKVWKSIGEETNDELINTLFDDTYIKTLESKYSNTEITKSDAVVKVDSSNELSVEKADAMLKKSATVNFIKSTAKFSDTKEASSVLEDFIKTAKVLDGTIIQIEGNTDPNPYSDPKDTLNKKLSKSRAETVKKYFVMNGIDADRIVVIGNGSSKPIAKNDTEANRAKNRRTDISFKSLEQ